MKDRKHANKRMMLLVSVLLMLVLCGCRTRLTNNTEVSSVITDEDGFLTGEYEMRRDELGIPVAEKPIFTGWGSDDDDDSYDYNDDTSIDYDPNQDSGWDEPDYNTSNSSNSSTGTGNDSGNSSNSNTRPGNNTSSKGKIKITLDLNDDAGSKNTIKVDKNTKYIDFLPSEALREGYDFIEWTTDKKNKHPVDLNEKATKDQTLYAHWKKAEPKPVETPVYNIKWEYDNDATVADADKLPVTTTDGKYPDPLPTAHKKNYHFTGWDNGSGLITPGQDCTGDSRLVAKFDSWEKIYNDAKPADDKKASYVVDDGLDDLARGNVWDAATSTESAPAYVIIKLDDDEFTEEKAKDAAAEKRKAEDAEGNKIYKDSVIIVVPKDAANNKNELYYRLLIHNSMYGGLNLDKVAEDTEAVSTAYYESKPNP